jgi:deoxyribose-phosphate aldolase
MAIDRDALVDAVTRRVMASLSSADGDCAGCTGSCVMRCPDRIASAVASGASRLSPRGPAADIPGDLAKYIDHTLLKPDSTAAQIDTLCDEARQYRFAAVCVNPTWVRRCVERLRGTGVAVASVVGFPFGATLPEVKAFEARRVIRDGAREIDMVINIGALRSRDLDLVRRDVAAVSDACHEVGGLNKVIIETAMLTDEEKVIACRLAKQARADFVKTSTGFGGGGATAYDIALMREAVGPDMGVKAAGGVRSAETAREMIAAGATRLGATVGVKIVTGAASASPGGAAGPTPSDAGTQPVARR